MKLRYFLKIFAFLGASILSLPSASAECKPAPPDAARIIKITETWYTVRGELADYNPCDKSISFDMPFGKTKPPLMIIAHGGGGKSKYTEMAAYAFRRLGMATLVYDAYQMNNLNNGYDFFNKMMTNEARQRMIFKVTKGAYEWAKAQEKIDNKKIYFWGVSNGAAVVVNMAAVVDPAHVRGVFAEGLPPNGLGLPEELRVPVFLAFGESDDYGTRAGSGQKQWTREGRCAENTEFGDLSRKNSLNCNALIKPNEKIETVESWSGRLIKNNQPLKFKIYQDAAHDFFVNGPVKGTQIKNGRATGASVGTTHKTRTEYLKDVSDVVFTSDIAPEK